MIEDIIIPTNEYQTPVTKELLNSLPEEVAEQLVECLTTIPFVKHLISPNRPLCKDLPKDDNGRAIIDITNPPIITDTDYFRQPALHFLKHGCYTFLRPNSNPNSEYRKYWDREIKRCWEGLTRPTDGAWVSGYNYWFLNYQPMMINKRIGNTNKAIRVEEFPYFNEGNAWRYYYLDKARNEGHHAIELAKRGASKSYALSGIMGRNLILGESEEAHKRIITILTAYQKEYLSDSKDGTLSKFKPALNFSLANTPFPNLLLKNSPNEMTWQMGYKDEYGREKGTLNQVMAVSAKDDSSKLRGKRGTILYEEMGSFSNLLTLYDTTRKSVEDGDLVFAFMYLVGTASEDESDFASAKTLLYNPEAYNILANTNVYDRPKQGKDKFGYFFPAYVNRAGCYNEDGISDVVKSLIQVLLARYKAKHGANPQSVLRVIAEDPITPAEAIVKVKTAYFPVAALTERLQEIDLNVHSFDDVFTGRLVLNNKGIPEFMHTNEEPIRKYGVSNDTQGCIEIFDMPEKIKNEIPANRYCIGTDPYDNDKAESNSLYSIIVFDLWKDKIVAEYTGRPPFADDAHEIVRLLCMYYNAKAMFEANKKGWYAYFAKMSSTNYLATTPEYLREKQLVKYSSFGSNRFGININLPLKDYANNLIKDWLNKPIEYEVKTEDKIETVKTLNLYTIRNRALLEELIAYNPEINTDRISALAQVMLYREEKLILYRGKIEKNSKKGSDKKGDDFFAINYNNRIKSVNLVRNPAQSS